MHIQGMKVQFKLSNHESDKGGEFWFVTQSKLEFEDSQYSSRENQINACMRAFRNDYWFQFESEFATFRTLPNTSIVLDESYFVKVVNMLKTSLVIATLLQIKEESVVWKDKDVTPLFNPANIPTELKLKIFPQSINQNVETKLEFDVSIKVPEIQKDRESVLKQDSLGEYDLRSLTLQYNNMQRVKELRRVSSELEVAEHNAGMGLLYTGGLERAWRSRLSLEKVANGEWIEYLKEAYSESLLSVVFQQLVQSAGKSELCVGVRFFKVSTATQEGESLALQNRDLSLQSDKFIGPMRFEMLSSNQTTCCFVTVQLGDGVVLHVSTAKEQLSVQVFDGELEEVHVKMSLREDLARLLSAREVRFEDVLQKVNSRGQLDWEPSVHH